MCISGESGQILLRDLAESKPTHYNAERIPVNGKSTRMASIALMVATRQVLRNGWAMIGVLAPNKR
jgi:arginyl-tRNA synthetase